MKTRTYEGRVVALLQKTSHGISRVCDTFVAPNGQRRVASGTQMLVENRTLTDAHTPQVVPKPELSGNDKNRLSAARGLPRILLTGAKPDRSGRLPSVCIYNLALKLQMLVGVPIEPLS